MYIFFFLQGRRFTTMVRNFGGLRYFDNKKLWFGTGPRKRTSRTCCIFEENTIRVKHMILKIINQRRTRVTISKSFPL